MSDETTPESTDAETDRELERLVHDAARSMGWVPPDSDDTVRQAEANLAQPPPLPEALDDPIAILNATGDLRGLEATPLGPAGRIDCRDDLARAARGGADVPEDIERQMRRDREAAEQAFDEHDDGENTG